MTMDTPGYEFRQHYLFRPDRYTSMDISGCGMRSGVAFVEVAHSSNYDMCGTAIRDNDGKWRWDGAETFTLFSAGPQLADSILQYLNEHPPTFVDEEM